MSNEIPRVSINSFPSAAEAYVAKADEFEALVASIQTYASDLNVVALAVHTENDGVTWAAVEHVASIAAQLREVHDIATRSGEYSEG